MIDYFEDTKSNRSTCQRCKQFITDKKRGVAETISFGHKQKQYFCIKCSGKIIKEVKEELQGMEETLQEQAQRIKQETAYEEGM